MYIYTVHIVYNKISFYRKSVYKLRNFIPYTHINTHIIGEPFFIYIYTRTVITLNGLTDRVKCNSGLPFDEATKTSYETRNKSNPTGVQVAALDGSNRWQDGR